MVTEAQPRPAEQTAGSTRATARVLLAALLLAVTLRVLLGLAAPAQLHHPEEFVNLRLAAGLLGDIPQQVQLLPEFPAPPPGGEATGRSFFDYQYQDWDGGTLVVAIVLVPLALLFGLTTTAVKAGALLWCIGGLVLWVAVLGRLYGSPGLRYSAICFAAMPVPYVLQSCIHWGNHVESAGFVPLGLLALLWAADGDDRKTRARRSLCAGLVFGFGTWFSLLNLAPALLAGLLLPLVMGRDSAAALGAFAAGCVLGLLPWLGRNDLSDLGGGLAHGQSLAQVAGAALSYGWDPSALWELFSRYPKFAHWQIHGLWSVPDLLATALDLLTRVLVVVSALIALGAAARAVRSDAGGLARRRLLVLLVLVGSALAIPLLLASQGEHSDRRLGPVYPLIWAALAAGLCALGSARRKRATLLVLLAPLLAANLLATAAVISSWDRPNDAFEPWQHFALPAAEPRDRTDACVPHVASDQVAALGAGLARVFSSSDSGGYAELRGVCRAFAARGTFLQRDYPGCPDRWDVDIMQLWLVDSDAEAAALGMGLRIRCPDTAEEVAAICGQLHGQSYRDACLAAPVDH